MGSLPDLPGKRLALDLDGTQMLMRTGTGAWTDVTPSLANSYGLTDAAIYSHTSNPGQTSPTYEFCLLFPSAVDIVGYFALLTSTAYGVQNVQYSYSLDTTTGIDGTWTAYAAAGYGTVAIPYFRDSISAYTLAGVKGFRFKWNNYAGASGANTTDFETFHLYGSYAQSGDRLQFWNPGNDLPLDANFLNYQDVGKGTTPGIRSFTVKNLSATGTATNVQVINTGMAGAAFADGAGTGVEVSLDQTSWFNTVGLGDLAPGAQSAPVYVRNVLPSSLFIGPHAARLTLSTDGIA